MSIFPHANHNWFWAICLVLLSGSWLNFVGMDLVGFGIACLLILIAFVLLADWFVERRVREQVRLNEAMQEDVKVLQELRMMTAEQIEAVHESRVIREHIFGSNGPKHDWIFADGTNRPPEHYTTEEVLAVWSVCDEEWYPALSTWNDETRNRKCATALMNYCLYNGWLERPNGNRPAIFKYGGFDNLRVALWEG